MGRDVAGETKSCGGQIRKSGTASFLAGYLASFGWLASWRENSAASLEFDI